MADKAKGRIVWHDLVTSEPDAAIGFYNGITGWGTMPFEGPGGNGDYRMWTVGEQPIGGVMTMPHEVAASGAPPHWMAYVATDDIDAAAAKVGQLGGQVMTPPTDIPTIGRFAICADPQGAIFAIFEAAPDAETPGHDGDPNVGEFSWHELVTTDYRAAFDFYSALFGWENMQEMDMGDAGIYLIYGRPGGRQLGGMFNKMPDMPMPPMWIEYALVDDVNAAADKVKAGGGQILNGPMEVPGGDLIVQCMDPQGAMFALHSKA